LATVAVALFVAVPAYAGGSTAQAGYPTTPNNQLGLVAKAPKKSSPTTPSAIAPVKTSGTLPFTGIDLGLFALAAVVLTGTGVTFRRLGRRSN
jgi:hypothetical protein